MTPIGDPVYLPDATGVPAERFVVFTTPEHDVMIIDESRKQADGAVFTGTWESPSLNRQDQGRIYTIRRVTIYYEAESNTTFTLKTSGDGGENWVTQQVSVAFSSGQIKQVTAVVSGVSGSDPRIAFDLDQNLLIKIVGYRAVLIPRGLEYISG